MKVHLIKENVISFLYDAVHRVETRSNAELYNLTVLTDARGCFRYEPTPASSIRHVLKCIRVDFEQTSFVDMGSGKGRCLLVAAEYPFARVIGVEFAKELHETACRNIRKFRGKRRCRDVTSCHADARDFPFPPGSLLLHFSNPFGDQVMESVLGNITRHDGPVTLAFVSGRYAKNAVQTNAHFSLTRRSEFYDFYRLVVAH